MIELNDLAGITILCGVFTYTQIGVMRFYQLSLLFYSANRDHLFSCICLLHSW